LPSRPAASAWWSLAAGMRDILPVVPSVAAYALVFGMLARQKQLSLAEISAMSGLVFAGSSQFVALGLWTTPLPLGAIVGAVLIINLRYVFICASCRPLFTGANRLPVFAAMFFVADENWAMTMGKRAQGAEAGAMHLVGGGVLLYLVWVLSSIMGDAAGTLMPDPARWGLDFTFAAAFLALLTGMWRGRSDLLPWGIAAACAIAAARLLPGNWYIIVGGLAGSISGVLLRAD
jgi:predicted branched-subunit amino acid permease